jgi:hypothetical protein
MTILYIYCLEDDRQLTSPFMLDVQNLTMGLRKGSHTEFKVFIRYRGYSFFPSFDIQMNGRERPVWDQIPTIKYTKGTIMSDMSDFLKTHYTHSKESYLLIQSHGHDAYIQVQDRCDEDEPKCVNDKMYLKNFAELCMESKFHFDAILLDSCCMSTLDTHKALQNITKYVVACQTSCPHLGVIYDNFLQVLGEIKSPIKNRLMKISRAFVRRNANPTPKLAYFAMATDSVVVDMNCFKTFANALDKQHIKFKPLRKYRVMEYKGYLLYDLYSLLVEQKQTVLATMLKNSVKQYKFIPNSRKRINSDVMNGVSINIEKKPPTLRKKA